MPPAPTLAIITCSYAPDLHRCERLCRSVDQFAGDDIEHVVMVPARDQAAFSRLATPKRRILAVQDVVPGNFMQLPVLNKWWLHNGYLPVRGWVMQQITKLSASLATNTEYLIFADSDLQLIKPLTAGDLVKDGRHRFHAIKGAMDYGEHLHWHHVASQLLGLPEQYAGYNYNGQLITWRRSDLERLHARIEEVTGQPWATAIARCRTVSEYILYGNFIERLGGNVDVAYYRSDSQMVHSCWTEEQFNEFLNDDSPFAPNIIAMHIQSNLNLSAEEEARVISERLKVKTAG